MEGLRYSPENRKDLGRILYDNVQNSPVELRSAIAEVYNRKVAASKARVNLKSF